MINIIYPKLSYTLTGILFKAHNNLGKYCSEKQYADAVEKYLKAQGIKYEREKVLSRVFEGEERSNYIHPKRILNSEANE